MNIDQLIEKIKGEQQKGQKELQDAEGMTRLQKMLEQYQGEYKLRWSDEILEDLKQQTEPTKFFANIKELDKATGGFRPQQLITLAAHTKHGKTAFGMHLIAKMEDISPVLIPLEQSGEEIIWQCHENGYRIPRFLAPENLASEITVDWIENRVVEGIAKYNTRMVVIDNLDWIDDTMGGKHKNENVPYRIGKIMRGLKSIATRWNILIVIQVHISQTDEGNPPVLKDLKNSSDIAQNSDIVMMLWRKNWIVNKVRQYTNKSLLSIQANRRKGKNRNIGFAFDEQTGEFLEDQSWVDAMENTAEAELNEEF